VSPTQHRFVIGHQQQPASNNHLPHFTKSMKKFNARRKFKVRASQKRREIETHEKRQF
jgi:hypothetical protein